ncbi:MAG: hypothetical protein U0R71_14640 [Solirubrobacterales bacterium]
MSNEGESGSFLETGLDWTSEDFSSEEKQQLLAWYEQHHEAEHTKLSRFPDFWIEHDPGGFKRYRRHMIEIDDASDPDSMPGAAHLFMYLGLYTVFANEKGILYLVVNARTLGATRAEVVDAFRIAALSAGPFGINAAAELADEYLRAWPEDSGEPGIEWPRGWAPDPDALKSGIDHSTNEMSDADLAALRGWYERVYGEVPRFIEVLAADHPVALKTQRIRLEASLGEALPAQMAPLSWLLLAAQRQWPTSILRAGQMARHLGVRRRQAIETVFWAGVYAGEATSEVAIEALAPVLDGWE